MNSEKIRLSDGDARYYFLRIGIALLMLAGIRKLLQYAVSAIFAAYLPEVYYSWWFLWLLSLVPLYLFAFPVYRLLLPKKLVNIEKNKLPKEFFAICVTALALLVVFNIVGYWFTELLSLVSGGALSDGNALDKIISSSPAPVTFLIACVLAPVLEELTFRKLLLDRVASFGELPACVMSGLMFGLFHGNFRQFFYTAALGTVFAYVYVRTGKFIIPVLMHSGLNVLGSIVTPYTLSDGNIGELTAFLRGEGALGAGGIAAGITYLLGAAAVVAGAILVAVGWRKIKFGKTTFRFPARETWLNPAVICAGVFMAAMFVFSLI